MKQLKCRKVHQVAFRMAHGDDQAVLKKGRPAITEELTITPKAILQLPHV
jgi:hypothetical protein